MDPAAPPGLRAASARWVIAAGRGLEGPGAGTAGTGDPGRGVLGGSGAGGAQEAARGLPCGRWTRVWTRVYGCGRGHPTGLQVWSLAGGLGVAVGVGFRGGR